MGRSSPTLTAESPRTPTARIPRTEARAGMAMSLATFAMAAASAVQAVLYLSLFGATEQTDGFFVAFAVYTTFGVFSQSLRLTSVPLLIEPTARLTVREFAAGLGLVAVPVLLLTEPLAGRFASVIAPGLGPSGRSVTESALMILGPAIVLQLWAAGAATVLAVRGNFSAVATSYIAGAAAGLIVFLLLMETAGELTLGWSMLAMAVVTASSMGLGVRASGGLGDSREPLRVRPLLGKTGLLLGRTLIYLALNLLFVVTLAYASRSVTGDTTVLSYAYLFASYLVAGTGMALGMSRIPDMTRIARADRRAVLDDTVLPGFRYAMLLAAPALAGLVAAGALLVHDLFPTSLDADGVSTLRVFAALLAVWTFPALVVSLLLPALFAFGRATAVNLLALPLVALHLAATAGGSALFGVNGAVAALAIAPAAFAMALIVLAAGRDSAGLVRRIGMDALRFSLLAAASYGLAAILGESIGGLGGALVTGALGSVLYVAGMPLVAPRQVTVLLGALRPTGT